MVVGRQFGHGVVVVGRQLGHGVVRVRLGGADPRREPLDLTEAVVAAPGVEGGRYVAAAPDRAPLLGGQRGLLHDLLVEEHLRVEGVVAVLLPEPLRGEPRLGPKRIEQPRHQLTDEEALELSARLAALQKGDVVCVTYYDQDAYTSIRGVVTRIDEPFRMLRVVKTDIPFDDILRIEDGDTA